MHTHLNINKTFEEDEYFNSRLFVNLSKYKKESIDSFTNQEMRLSISTASIQNFLSKDLIKTIEESVPLKPETEEYEVFALEEWTTDTSARKNSPRGKGYNKPKHPQNQLGYYNNNNFRNPVYKPKKEKTKKVFVERVGDWTCFYCKNLNFSFRMSCNKCCSLKVNSEKEHDTYMDNVLKIIIENEKHKKK